MYFEDSLYGQGIVQQWMSATTNGYALNDSRGYDKMPDGMKDLCWKDDIDKIMEYYGIPKQKVSVLSGKTGRYTSNKENQQMFLAVDILPVHIPLVEEYFKYIWNPFIPNYLFAKKQFNDARQYAAEEQQPTGSRKDPITWQFIDDKWNVVGGGRKNPNPYWFSEEGGKDDIDGRTDQVPVDWQSNWAGEQGELPTESLQSDWAVPEAMTEQ